MSSQQQFIVTPPYAWLIVFVPALAYFVGSHFHAGELGVPISTPEMRTTASDIFRSNSARLHLVQANLSGIVASTWKHDEELGRGFLLMSSASQNRIWRWERGGGPISLGKTLFMQESGCRSGLYANCSSETDTKIGSGGLAIDFGGKENPWDGQVTVAEWGEGRIARLETSGARTPLVIMENVICGNETNNSTKQQQRIGPSTSMLYTPFGDLLISENDFACGGAAIHKLSQATSIPPIQSTWDSRLAHQWTRVQHNHKMSVWYHGSDVTRMGGMTIDDKWTGVYATVQRRDGKVELVQLTPNSDDVEDDDEESAEPTVTEKILFDLSSKTSTPGPLAVDNKGNLFVGIDEGVLILTSSLRVLGSLAAPTPTSLVLGEDGYLYITSLSSLYRIRMNNGPLKLPTNLIRK